MSAKEMLRIAEEEPDEFALIRARERIKGLGDREVVDLYFREGIGCPLTDAQQFIADRWSAVRRWFLTDIETYGSICDKLMADFGVAIATARRDIRDATKIFGQLDVVHRDAHRVRAIDMALAAYRVAEKASDSDGMVKAQRAYAEAAGIHADADAPDFDKIMDQRVYATVLDDQVRELFLAVLQQGDGSVDVAALMRGVRAAQPTTIDVEHEELP